MRLRELYMGVKPYSYIAFSVSDADAVEPLIDNLDGEGYRYWFNSKLTPNEKDVKEILERMKNAAVSVVVLSPGITDDALFSDVVEFLISKRTPFIIYMTRQTPELVDYLSRLLERAKGVVVFREWEQKFSTSNSLKQALSVTKGITKETAKAFYESGINAMQNENATPETMSMGLKNIIYAADFEYPPALCFLGDFALEKARCGKDSYSTAVAYYRSAVKLGDTDAIYKLGCLIADGECFDESYELAKPYILYAAKSGIADAQYRYAKMLDNGDGISKNRDEATVWYKKALDGGDRRAYLPLAKRYLDGETVNRNETVAAQYFAEAAEEGSTEAILTLAKLYRDGVGVKKDSLKSETYFRMAAEKEVPEAQYEYARILQGKKNFSEAFRWLSYAALEREYGDKPMPKVLFELGQCYSYGKGTDIDRKTAFMYYHKAALAGDPDAKAAVAECYKKGIGVTINKRAAEFFAREF